jgi:hypothetical protein
MCHLLWALQGKTENFVEAIISSMENPKLDEEKSIHAVPRCHNAYQHNRWKRSHAREYTTGKGCQASVDNKTARKSADIQESGPAQPDHSHGDYSSQTGTFMHAPSIEEAQAALDNLKRILKPPRATGRGYKDPGLDLVLRERLDGMKQFLWAYVNPQLPTYGKWTAASLSAASALERSPFHAQMLWDRVRAFIADRGDLPFNVYGTGKANECLLNQDEELAQDINLHLQGIGKWVKAMDLVDYLNTPEMRQRTGLTKRIHVTTAQQWMNSRGLGTAGRPLRKVNMWMDMNERMLWLTDNMYSFQHGDVLMPELKTSLVSMKKTNQPHYQLEANGILSFGSMTNRHFMQMIVVRHDGYPRTKQQCLR